MLIFAQFSSYPKCTLHDDFNKFLESRMFCDVEFILGPEMEKIPAHMAIVAARSQWLRHRIQQGKETRAHNLEKVCSLTLKNHMK